MTTVVNFKDVRGHWNSRTGTWDDRQYVYIGRVNKTHFLPASKWANQPLEHERGETDANARRRSLDAYRAYLERQPELLAALHELRNKTLVCWCKPFACHGDVLVELLEGLPQPEAAPAPVALDGTVEQPGPVFAWDHGAAGRQIAQDRHGRLYRSDVLLERSQIGLPGMEYTEWLDWYRDYLKIRLRVHGCSLSQTHEQYARFRYEHYLAEIADATDSRQTMEREILQELLAELEGKDCE